MNISGINLYSYKIHKSNYHSSASGSCSSFASFAANKPDTVSFGNSKKVKCSNFVYDMRELENMNCACCGIKMLKTSDAHKFLNSKVYFPAYTALAKLEEDNFRVKRTDSEYLSAYKYLKTYAAQHKNLTINDILAKDDVKSHRKRLSVDESNAFEQIREQCNLVSHSSRYLIAELEKLKPDFQEHEQKVYEELKKLSEIYPDDTFNTILNKPVIRKVYLNSLRSKQIAVLDKLKPVIKDLPYRYMVPLEQASDNARKIFVKEDDNVIHKGRRVVSSFYEIADKIPDVRVVEEIRDIIDQLPDSKNDVDAFMVRAAKKSSNAVMDILISRIRSTYEHVIPHHRKDNNGPSEKTNYICLCGKCNVERQQLSYEKFVDVHPEMIQNTQKQIDKIIYFINKGLLYGYDNYPAAIKEGLSNESGGNEYKQGKIFVDISKLDLAHANINRQLRQQKIVESQIEKSLAENYGIKCKNLKPRHKKN